MLLKISSFSRSIFSFRPFGGIRNSSTLQSTSINTKLSVSLFVSTPFWRQFRKRFKCPSVQSCFLLLGRFLNKNILIGGFINYILSVNIFTEIKNRITAKDQYPSFKIAIYSISHLTQECQPIFTSP